MIWIRTRSKITSDFLEPRAWPVPARLRQYRFSRSSFPKGVVVFPNGRLAYTIFQPLSLVIGSVLNGKS
jgi:hypothetical protein